jgi:hypothetical protein
MIGAVVRTVHRTPLIADAPLHTPSQNRRRTPALRGRASHRLGAGQQGALQISKAKQAGVDAVMPAAASALR